MGAIMVVSSANNIYCKKLLDFPISFMQIKNSTVPKMVAWGKPDFISKTCELMSSKTTYCFLFNRYISINFLRGPEKFPEIHVPCPSCLVTCQLILMRHIWLSDVYEIRKFLNIGLLHKLEVFEIMSTIDLINY